MALADELARLADAQSRFPEIHIDVESFGRLNTNPNAMTKIEYEYRDGANYKAHGSAVLAGAATADQVDAILNGLDDEGGFIPGQVGLSDLQTTLAGGWKDEVDHPFHEISSIELVLDGQADNSISLISHAFATVTWDESYQP